MSVNLSSDERAQQLAEWLGTLPAELGIVPSSLAAASADASFRRYFRVESSRGSLIVMDAPPPKEDVRPFCRIGALLLEAGLNAPQILARDEDRGFLVLTDLGRQTFLQSMEGMPDLLEAIEAQSETIHPYADRLMMSGIDALVRWQKASRPGVLPEYDEAVLRRELGLFPEWYIGRHLGKQPTPIQEKIIRVVFDRIVAKCLAQPQVFVHRDWMPRNLMVSDPMPGILDFQDALWGPITYDVVSMMRDAFWSWPENWVLEWTIRYWEKARAAGLPVHQDFGAFWEDFEWMGVQRHIKVMGIFARITHRDGKPKYVADTPRFEHYLRTVCGRYDGLKPMIRLFNELEGKQPVYGYTY